MRSSVEKLTGGIVLINEARSIDELLLVEARMRQEYFSCWDDIIRDSKFAFDKRTRRPPRNPVNALISFGNVFLYNRVATEIYKTSLDIRIGICHAANRRSESLNLDISDIFKPVIVDRVIFSCIHNHELKADLHFEPSDGGGIYLSAEGKKIFIRALERKLYQRITVKGEKISYQALLRKEVQKLMRVIQYGEKYKPYKYY
jgi:CRISPR-associated endonuclease Cas1